MKRYEVLNELLDELHNIERKKFRVGHDLTKMELMNMKRIVEEEKRMINDIKELKDINNTLKKIESISDIDFCLTSSRRKIISFTKSIHHLFVIFVPDFIIFEIKDNDFKNLTATEKLEACIKTIENRYTLRDRLSYMNEEVIV